MTARKPPPDGIKHRRNRPSADPKARFMAKVRYTAYGCWEWNGSHMVKRGGYARFTVPRNPDRYAFHWSYRFFKGEIPEGLCIDHLCRNTGCVNPNHLEAVTHQVNSQRGITGQATGLKNRRKTHCPHGHPYSGDNLYIPPKGGRICRTCNRLAQVTYSKRKRERNA